MRSFIGKSESLGQRSGRINNNKAFLQNYIKNKYLLMLLAPVLIYFIVFHYGPMYGIIIAFKEFYPTKGILGSEWAGFVNFEKLFTGLYFIPVLKNTLIISFYKLVFGFPAPIIICLLLNEVRKAAFKRTIQTISYLPHFISWVVLAGIVREILSPSRGSINYFLQLLGFEPIFFVADAQWFRFVLVGSAIWKEVGWQSIIYLAAVSGINPELYDVADLDGAGRFRRIWSITIPSIIPIIIIMFILAAGSIINDDFEQIFNLLNSNVLSVGDVISTYTYREGLQQMNYSYATAVGLFKNTIALILVTFTNYLSQKFSSVSLW